jgi:hypothetical protein
LMGGGGGGGKVNWPAIDDPCVMLWLISNYGMVGGFIVDTFNLQQYDPQSNPNWGKAAKDGAIIGGSKLAALKGPTIAGERIASAIPGQFAIGHVFGSGLAWIGGLASGTVEVAGAFMTPFATTALSLAREACKKDKQSGECKSK